MRTTNERHEATESPYETRPRPNVKRKWAGTNFRKSWTAFGSTALLFAGLLAGVGFAAPAHAAPNTVVSLTFDDGNADQLTAEATMKNLGLVGTFFITTGWVDQPSYLTSANLQQIAADGNEIGGHTVTHPDLVSLTSAESTRQICNGRVALMNMGFKVTSFAYPFASEDPATEALVKGCGFNSARGLGDAASKDPASATLPAADTIPPANAYDTKAPDEVDSTWTLQDLQNQVTHAQTTGGGWVQLTFHHIATNTDPTLTITPTLFTQFATWLAQQKTAGTVAVKTVDQVVGGAQQPAVPGPAVPPPPTPGTNMIQNPSLETLVNTVPQCWAAGGYGTNTPAFSIVTPGHTGNNAEQLTMTGWVSGDAKLLPALDLGGCSPTGIPGHTYQLKAWYKSTVDTQFEVYYRTGSGFWQYWTASPLVVPAANWTQITWNTPPLPAGASGISWGLNIQANGTITTDDYEMYDNGVSFADIPPTYPFYNEITWLAANGITTGFPQSNGTTLFEPLQSVSREAMAAFIYRYKGSPAFNAPAVSPFTDVPTSDIFYKEITWLANTGITTGYPGPNNTKSFHPLDAVNRDAMAAFIYRMTGSPAVTVTKTFLDVPPSYPFYKEISWLAAEGITTGWAVPGGAIFQPLQPVHRDATAAFLYRLNAKFPRP
ncbi:S-layer homology domain-containing protein [Arthrobacter bambusae]|uniref:S-layer homology domain-containing protein n=1 Tax=Arthrobacter bambusae TaxID=1338426 RepID=UPI00277E3B5D|nr:S-layer homology domain-containing protein [Arthrobacter bambusae]MDQ0031488.1 peptidoglycan/xylan/chitin deacetylase (PgdA/CDA1 family) [Arthrobacter bambusae]MDQ0099624.1 peptidoglycan/xylan/chitin deacetylase (PgdA/CDA1 family) [Arthrobacter bambusae]